MNNDKTEQQRILRNLKKTELLELLIEENNENERLYKLLQEQKGSEDTGNGAQGPVDLDESEEAVSPADTSPEKVKGLQAWKNVLKTENLKEELQRIRYIEKYRSTIRSTVSILITVAALAILVANFLVPAFQIYGNSMTPTLSEGEIVLALKGDDYEIGQLIAFYYNNKILVKRVIAGPGDWVDIDEEGNTYVNNQLLDEPYVSEKSLGDCNIELPYQVPENRIFVMGDHRSVSVDSRNSSIGCISQEQIAGKLVFRVWPLPKFGGV
jgi:signal peptidase I